MITTNHLNSELKERVAQCKFQLEKLEEQHIHNLSKAKESYKSKMAELGSQRNLLESTFLALEK